MSKRILLGLSTILFCSNFIYSMDPHIDSSNDYSLDEQFLPYDKQGISEADINMVWEKAPNVVKKWSEELKLTNGLHQELPYRLVLYGVPGTGKTTMALGIAKNNSEKWCLSRINAANLATNGRGSTAENLRKKFNRAVQDEVKTIVLIDEAHHIMANHANKNYDTAETTGVLQAFLDRYAENQNVMVILTANYVDDMTPEMRTRISHCGVKINAPTKEELCKMFEYHGCQLAHEKILKKDLLDAYTEGDITVGRDVKFFCRNLRNAMRSAGCTNFKEFPLSRDFLIAQAKQFKEEVKDFGSEKKSLSDREYTRLENDRMADRNERFQIKFACAGFATKVAYDQYRESQSRPSLASPKDEETSSSATSAAAKIGGAAVGGAAIASTVAGKTALATKATAALGSQVAAGSTFASQATAVANGALAIVSAHPYVAGGAAVATAVGGIYYYYWGEEKSPSLKQD